MDVNIKFRTALTIARREVDAKGRFREPHELRRVLEEGIKADPRWALRVLQRVRENVGPTPERVAHWVTWGASSWGDMGAFLSRIEPVVLAGNPLPEADRARLERLALRYAKQAVARALLAG